MTIHHSTRRWLLAAGCALAAGLAHAQAPATVRLLVGYAAGGPVDQAARMVAPVLARELGSTVIVENRPGANGATAGDAVAKTTPDSGLLWFAASPTVTISPNVVAKMPFDPARDLTALAPILSYYNVLVINRDLPFKSLKELVDHAKANPGKVSYGSAGVGGSNHLSGELLAARTGTKMLHVPYKGNAPAMADVMGGQLTMMFDIIGTARNFIAGDKVRAVAVTSPARNPSLPGVPTMTESGIPEYEVGGWFALYGPSRMPPALAGRYSQAMANALRDPELKSRLEAAGYELWQASPDAVDERARKERATWATVTRDIKVE